MNGDSARGGLPPAEVETLACRGGFVLETREDDLDGQPINWQQLQALDLLYAPLSGALSGTGPGELTGVRRGKAPDPSKPNGPLPGANANVDGAVDELQYLHIDYRRGFRGNLRQRLITFDNQIKAVSGAVAGWADRLDPDAPEKLGPRGMTLTCDQLIVGEAPFRDPKLPQAVELQALGNTIIEGAQIHRSRLSPDLRAGQGSHDAGRRRPRGRRLELSTSAGAPLSKASAARLTFFPQSQRVDVDGGRMIDLGQLPGAKDEKKK
ncbi:MAG: hypothetical protein QM811_24270 [Pirellulales bacterium]